jgi:hypothetical protein
MIVRWLGAPQRFAGNRQAPGVEILGHLQLDEPSADHHLHLGVSERPG